MSEKRLRETGQERARSQSGFLPLRSFNLRDSVTTTQDRAPTTATLANLAVHRVQHPRHQDWGLSSKVGPILRQVVGRRHHTRDLFHIHRRRVGQEVFNLVLDMQAYGAAGDVYQMSPLGPFSGTEACARRRRTRRLRSRSHNRCLQNSFLESDCGLTSTRTSRRPNLRYSVPSPILLSL